MIHRFYGMIFRAEEGGNRLGWFLLGFAVAVPVAVIWWLMSRPEESTYETKKESALVKTARAPLPASDDLTRISGIGPKVSSLLRENGIHTFAQLAAEPVARLNAMLDEAGLYMANPSDWPEHARALSQ